MLGMWRVSVAVLIEWVVITKIIMIIISIKNSNNILSLSQVTTAKNERFFGYI